jgi:hypothetical protein
MWSTIVVLASILFLPKVHLNFCELKADITFLIDKSASIAENKTHKLYEIARERIKLVKSFILDSVKLMQLAEDKIRVAIATFNREFFYLNTFDNQSSYDLKLFEAILNDLTYTRGDMNSGTLLSSALSLVHNILYHGKGPEGKEGIIMIFTDGQFTEQEKHYISTNSKLLRGNTPPYKIIAIGIGSHQGFYDELLLITGNETLTLTLGNYIDLPIHVNTLIAKVCPDLVNKVSISTIGPTSTPAAPSPTNSNKRALYIGFGVGGAVALLAAAAGFAYFYKNKLAGGKTSTSNNGSFLRNSTENPFYRSSGRTHENIMIE